MRAVLRLAIRDLRRHPLPTALCAFAVALPLSTIVAASVIAPGSEPDGPTSDGASGWTFSIIVTTASFAGLALLLLGVMVAAAMLLHVRRNERMLALLAAVGAPFRTLYLVVTAQGILIGSLAAALAVIGGLVLGFALADDPVVDVGTLIVIAAATVLVSWVVALVPATTAQRIEVTRILRDAPQPPRDLRAQGRAGHWTVLAGLAALMLGAIGGLAGSASEGPLARLLSAGAISFAAPSALLIVLGAVLALPSVFRTVGRQSGPVATSLRFAARDAERGGARSFATAASIMAACFFISSYVSFFGANETWTKESHGWTLERHQAAVELMAYGTTVDATVLEREIVDEPSTIDAAARILSKTVGTAEPRVIDGVLGPHWGMPVDDDEGYSGFFPVEFPAGGLPHPRLEPEGACAVAHEDGGPPKALCTEHPYSFELPQIGATIWAGDADDLALILGKAADAATLAAFDAGAAIALDPRYLAADDTVTLEWWGEEQFVPENEPGEFLPAGTPSRAVTLDAVTVPQKHPVDFGVFLSSAAAKNAGLDLVPARILAQAPRWIDQADVDAASKELSRLDPRLGFIAENGPDRPDRIWSWGATGIAGGITLALAVAAIGLSRFDGSRTDATLRMLGADRGIRRRINAWYALLVVGFSASVGTAAGALSLFGTAFALGASAPSLPFAQLSVMAFGVPVLAALIAWVLPVGRRRMPVAD